MIIKGLELTPTKGMSREQWMSFRMNGFGCSETGTLLGLNDWMSAGELFYQKIGLLPQSKEDNEPMAWGRQLEDPIGKMWEYYNPITCSYLENIDKKIIRKCSKFPYYVQNPKYPFLFGGPDRLFNHKKKKAILEIKSISSYSSDKWESGIPPSYVIQCQSYMLLFNLDYSEIAMLKDGRDFTVTPIERNKEIMQVIIDKGNLYWKNIIKARRILASGGNRNDIAALEPPVEETPAYMQFLNKKFLPDADKKITSTEEIEKHIHYYYLAKTQESDHKKEKEKHEIYIKNFMGDATVLEHDNGKITWREDKNGKRQFRS